jgi:hypothetical protein
MAIVVVASPLTIVMADLSNPRANMVTTVISATANIPKTVQFIAFTHDPKAIIRILGERYRQKVNVPKTFCTHLKSSQKLR